MIHDGKKKWIEKNYNKKFNQQMIMDFWMTKFGPLFSEVLILVIFLLDWLFPPLNMYNEEFLKWVTFHIDFINWLITTYGPLNMVFNIFFHSNVNFSIYMEFWNWDSWHF
jgi:hypothetical protein